MKKEKSTFTKKMKAYSALAGSLLAVGNSADAQQIFYTDVNPDFNGNTNGAFYDLDLNNDGTVDFKIQLNLNTTYYGGYNLIYAAPSGSSNGIGSSSSNPAALSTGSPIDGNMIFNPGMGLLGYSFVAYPGMYTGGNWLGATDKYLPLKIVAGCEIFYGWARLDVNSTGSSFLLKDFALNMIPGQVVNAGDMGTTIIGQPVLATIESSVLNYTENDPATQITSTLTVTDPDSPNLTGATVTLTCNYVQGEDTLAFTNQPGITGSFNAVTGTLTLSGVSSVTNYEVALRAVTYENLSDNPSTATRTAVFRVEDGTSVSEIQTRDISVTPVNDNPVLTSVETQALDYYTSNPATDVTTTLEITDVDNPSLLGATVQISGNYQSGEDVLSFVNQNGISGNFNTTLGIMTLTGSASVADYQIALRSVKYANSNTTNPNQSPRIVTYIATDGISVSNSQTRMINVTNDVGIADNVYFSGLETNPNPAKDIISIRFSSVSQGNITIRLNDMIGKTVKEVTLRKSDNLLQTTIDLNGLEKGIYFIEVNDGKNKTTKKIIKE